VVVFPKWFNTVLVLWLASSAAADIIITISMMALLLHAKASLFFGEETRDLLSRLTRIVLQTNLLTSVLALIALPLLLRGLQGIFLLPAFILGKSYVISLLAYLNARKRSNSPVGHDSTVNQVTPPTKLSTIGFSPANRHTNEGRSSNSMAASLPVHSVIQIGGLNGSIDIESITERV